MKPLLLLSLIILSLNAYPQHDILLLKNKQGKTIDRFFPGNNIHFQTYDFAEHDLYITAIANDTLFMEQYIIQVMPTPTGGWWPDTVQTYKLKYNYREIAVILSKKNTSAARLGTYFQIGGAFLGAVGLFNSIRSNSSFKDFFSGHYIYLAPALFAGGTLLKKSASQKKQIGKKFSLHYIHLSGTETDK